MKVNINTKFILPIVALIIIALLIMSNAYSCIWFNKRVKDQRKVIDRTFEGTWYCRNDEDLDIFAFINGKDCYLCIYNEDTPIHDQNMTLINDTQHMGTKTAKITTLGTKASFKMDKKLIICIDGRTLGEFDKVSI
jgi:hypothetical protein